MGWLGSQGTSEAGATAYGACSASVSICRRCASSGTLNRASRIRLAGSAAVRGTSSPGASCFLPRSSTVERILACRMLADSCVICGPHICVEDCTVSGAYTDQHRSCKGPTDCYSL